MTQKKGTRWNAYKAFIEPVAAIRKNLKILTYSTVHKVNKDNYNIFRMHENIVEIFLTFRYISTKTIKLSG